MNRRADLGWLAAGLAGALVLAWAMPRAYPLAPRDWRISKTEAEALALERFSGLGELPVAPYLVSRLIPANAIEARLHEALDRRPAEELRASDLGRRVQSWEVVVYSPSAPADEWSYRALIASGGRFLSLKARVPPDEARPEPAAGEIRRAATAFLEHQGIDLALLAEPEVRRRQLEARTDRVLRFARRDPTLGADLQDGVEVTFAGHQLTGFSLYLEDPEAAEIQARLQPLALIQQAWVFLAVPLLPLIAVPFVRRYHAGEIGVRRGLQIGGLIFVAGLGSMLLVGRSIPAFDVGVITRPQLTWVAFFQLVLFYFLPLGITTFLSWSVGEALVREGWSQRLAAFDALFRGRWTNRTFAAASLRGLAGGLGLAALMTALLVAARGSGIWAPTQQGSLWWHGVAWFSLPLVALSLVQALYAGLLGRLLFLTYLRRKLGRWGGTALAVVALGLLFFPLTTVFPIGWGPLWWILESAFLAWLFLRYGLWTSVSAHLTAIVVPQVGFLLVAEDPALRFQAGLAVLAVALPCLVSLRSLWSDEGFVYEYDEVPPHVARIARRERQKIELETARRIQASILPDLPPRLAGVEVAHAYLPATEVGGDFYDVHELADGRLAVAVGDVAGHGVSSGLVMSMAKSALAVQVGFDPGVEAVFATLNRMVFESAGKRLLATLCYAVVDPGERRLTYASAGHLFPFRIGAGGEVEALESVSYPLGVRRELPVRVRSTRLEAGDFLVLFSDGVIEARRTGSDELYGFERLEESLRRHGAGSAQGLCDGILADLETYTGGAEREDDLTLLVLRLP